MYLDHPRWYEATASLGHAGKRFPTPSGKAELWTPELEAALATAGHTARPVYFTHPEALGAGETLTYTGRTVANPLHPTHQTEAVRLGAASQRPSGFPLVGSIGRSSVAHFAGVTHWTVEGKLLDGVRYVQVHPQTAAAAGLADGDEVVVESPRGSIRGTTLVWDGIRPDTVFVPNGFGPAQRVGDFVGAPRYRNAANVLVDDRYRDTLSGQQAYKCFACRVRPA